MENNGEKKIYEKPDIWLHDIQPTTFLLVGSTTDTIIPDASRDDYGDPIDLLW